MVGRILFNLLQVAVVMAFAPLSSGVLTRLKERVQSKRGPSVFQMLSGSPTRLRTCRAAAE